jgi:acyl-CoA synthetase (AMP-forming)/AMP-acid ligase II
VTADQDLRTLPEALAAAAADPASGHLVHVLASGLEERQSYGQLRLLALRACTSLREAGVRPGHRVVLLGGASQHVLPAFWGCVLAGAVPAVLTAPVQIAHASEPSQRFRHVWEQLQRPLVLTTGPLRDEIDSVCGPPRLCRGHLLIDHLTEAAPAAEAHVPALDDVAALQFSSGSTGQPKGIRLTHRNLAVNLGGCLERTAMTRNDVFVNWMPHSHDMGLIGFHLLPLFIGVTQVTMAPLHFMRSPRVWFDKIREHRGTFLGITNFALGYVVQRVLERDPAGVDLSSVRLLCVGAEPVSPVTVGKAVRAGAGCGLDPAAIYPVYGMAEATLAVSLPAPRSGMGTVRFDREAFLRGEVRQVPPGEDREALEFVRLGAPLDCIEARILDPESGRDLPPGQVGQLWIRGASVAAGTETGPLVREDGWLETGDAGLVLDGQVMVTGRSKDVIFQNGLKLYAEDVEWRAAAALGLRTDQVVACGYTDERTGLERIAFFLKGAPPADEESAANALRSRIFQACSLWPDLLIPVSSIPKTTSGKIQRFKLRETLAGAGRAGR